MREVSPSNFWRACQIIDRGGHGYIAYVVAVETELGALLGGRGAGCGVAADAVKVCQ